MLSPPRELRSEAFCHGHSERGQPVKSDRATRMTSSKAAVASLMCHGGQERREKATLGRARHERRRIVSICESSRSANHGYIFSGSFFIGDTL